MPKSISETKILSDNLPKHPSLAELQSDFKQLLKQGQTCIFMVNSPNNEDLFQTSPYPSFNLDLEDLQEICL